MSGNHLVFGLTATDVAGNVSVTQTWTDDIAPAAPGTPALDAASDSGSSNSDGITNAQTLTFHGSCAADGDQIQLMDGATPVGTAVICASGAYTAQVAGLGEGSHAVSAIASRDGVDSAQSPPTTVVIDRTAPAMPGDKPDTASAAELHADRYGRGCFGDRGDSERRVGLHDDGRR